jgi:hypothetical protein
MPTHEERTWLMGLFSPPPDGTRDRELFNQWAAEMDKDPSFQAELKRTYRTATTIVSAQNDNGAGLLLDSQIREFALEYNGRSFQHGLRSLPSSFNVTEAFLEYDPLYALFRIREEKDHLCSFLEFLDYATSAECDNDIKAIVDYTQDGVIYSYNFTNRLGDFTFNDNEGREYGLSGFSIIRHRDELNIMAIVGELTNLEQETQKIREMVSLGGTPVRGREQIRPAKDKKPRAEPVPLNENFWRLLVLARLDLDRITYDARYLLRDAGDRYIVETDDLASLMDERIPTIENYEEVLKKSASAIESRRAIFEICNTLLLLPRYFDHYADLIIYERHPTKLQSRRETKTSRKSNRLLSMRERIKYRLVSLLNRKITRLPDYTVYKAPDVRVEVSGFWQHLPSTRLGTDKHGNPIHGKTWVEKTLTWVDSGEYEGSIQVATHNTGKKVSATTKGAGTDSPNFGYIYVMRSAAHERDIFKIGRTVRASDIRADELSRETGAADKFLVAQDFEVSDCVLAESMIHERLAQYRFNPAREFFKAPYKTIVQVIDEVIQEIDQS